jgi:hypothetical protein
MNNEMRHICNVIDIGLIAQRKLTQAGINTFDDLLTRKATLERGGMTSTEGDVETRIKPSIQTQRDMLV